MEINIKQVLQQGIKAHKEGKLDDAEYFYRTILKSQPLHPDANHNLGVIAISLNKIYLAMPLFKLALETNPKIEQFWLSYIDALIKANKVKDARLVTEKAMENGFDKKSFETLWLKSKVNNTYTIPPQKQINKLLKYYRAKQYLETEKLALSMTKEFPMHQFSWKVLGSVFKETGRIKESLLANQKSVQIMPNDSEAHFNLGNVLKDALRLEDAELSYRQAIALKPDYADAFCNLANTLSQLHRFDDAEETYRQAISLKPNYPEAQNNLGVTLMELGRLDEAEASFSRAIKLKPNYTSALMNRWQLLFDERKFEAALSDVDSCNTKESRACGLETLYALGRIDEIYQRIDKYSEFDNENIRMSAFSSFISELKKEYTSHKFCRNPLSFLHFSNISSHLEDSEDFIKQIINELNNVKTNWEPLKKSTHKGFQTLGNINLFEKPSEKIAYLKSIIFNELDTYYSKFKNETCSYIQKWPSKKILKGWHVILKQKGYQSPHIHNSGWLSGVIYLKVVPHLGRDEGAIQFSLSGENYSDLSSSKLIHKPKLGDIVFFPSSLNHKTIPFSTDTDRIIISFDLMPYQSK